MELFGDENGGWLASDLAGSSSHWICHRGPNSPFFEGNAATVTDDQPEHQSGRVKKVIMAREICHSLAQNRRGGFLRLEADRPQQRKAGHQVLELRHRVGPKMCWPIQEATSVVVSIVRSTNAKLALNLTAFLPEIELLWPRQS